MTDLTSHYLRTRVWRLADTARKLRELREQLAFMRGVAQGYLEDPEFDDNLQVRVEKDHLLTVLEGL